MTSNDEIAFLGKCEEFYRRIAGVNTEVKLLVALLPSPHTKV
jgi:hypothetical protein